MRGALGLALLAGAGVAMLACSSDAEDGSESTGGTSGAGVGATGEATGGSNITAGGSGGTSVGSGGTSVGSGGTSVGSGGTSVSSGGTSVGSGGTNVGSGGDSVGAGGSISGAGGSGESTGGSAGSAGSAGSVGAGGEATGGTGVTSGGSGGTSAGAGGAAGGSPPTTGGSGAAIGGSAGSSGGGAGNSAGSGGNSAGSGGSGGSTGGSPGSGGTSNVVLPTANAQFDYQIGGGYTPPTGVQVVSRDREDSPAAGLYNICYVNGFQIQPHEESWWQSTHPDLILRDANGDPVIDAGWDEMLVDVTTEAKREAAAAVIGAWIAQCAADGFDAVEIDNLDSYSRSDGLIAQGDNIAFMGMLADIAHANGLAAAQKNSVEFLDDVADMRTDFAIAEECNRWNECGDYQATYGNLVFVIEYRTQDFDAGCANFSELSIVLRNVAVSTPSSGNYVYDAC